MDIKQHASAIGRKRIADALGVGTAAVGEAVRAGVYPAAWFPAVRRLASECGIAAPESLFRWKGDTEGQSHGGCENSVTRTLQSGNAP